MLVFLWVLLFLNKTNSTFCCHSGQGGGHFDVVETDASSNPKSQDFFGFFSVDAFDFREQMKLVRHRGKKNVQGIASVLEAADCFWRKVLEKDKHLLLKFAIRFPKADLVIKT